MKLLLAGKWPPLKPLPVFKYETNEYRASIDFDKTRGEWVCRHTSLPSNKVQELRGGLPEITMALPHGEAEVFAECAAAEHQEQELEKDASRRLQAMLEWKENYENGALYFGLQRYLSESQREEIDEILRLTLTARQLQLNPKNISYVFDALSKAGGKLATLLEIAQQDKKEQEADVPTKLEAAAPEAERYVPVEAIQATCDRRLQMRTTPSSRPYVDLGGTNGGIVLNISEMGMAVAAVDALEIDDCLPHIRLQLPNSGQSIEISAQLVWQAESKKSAGFRFVDLTAETRHQISNWIASENQAPEYEALTPAPAESLALATLESFPEKPIESAFSEQDHSPLPELMTHTASHASEIVAPQILDVSPPSSAEELQEELPHRVPVAPFPPQVRTRKGKSPVDRLENAPSHKNVLEISGLQVAAFAAVFLVAVISLTIVLTVGRGPLGKRLRDAQQSILAEDATSPALPHRSAETTARSSTPRTQVTKESRSPIPSAQSPADSADSVAANKLRDATPPEEKSREGARDSESFAKVPSTNSSSTIASKPLVNPEASPARNRSAAPMARSAPPANPKPAHSPKAFGSISGVPRNPFPSRAAPAPRSSSPSAILVTAPAHGSKPFRVIFPEKPIAASSSMAVTSQLSVLVPPQPGPGPAHKPARLQAGELVSYVWPRYSRAGDRYGSVELIKVRTTIGQLGQVLDVKFVNGSISLLPATLSAIRQWRYKPTLLNNRPVPVQQDVTIEFRPPQYLSQARTQHPLHK